MAQPERGHGDERCLKKGNQTPISMGPVSCFSTPKRRVGKGAAAFPNSSLLVAIETSNTATVTKIHLPSGASFPGKRWLFPDTSRPNPARAQGARGVRYLFQEWDPSSANSLGGDGETRRRGRGYQGPTGSGERCSPKYLYPGAFVLSARLRDC